MSTRKTTLDVTVTGPGITLGDLRWLVAQCAGYEDVSAVSVQASRPVGQFDSDPDQITVHGRPKSTTGPVMHTQPGVRQPGARWALDGKGEAVPGR